ncbi:hypothetical protein MKW94_006579, partial [Papaver nudicaule]|nr:hypothetical protein [Papaver nudicaule]
MATSFKPISLSASTNRFNHNNRPVPYGFKTPTIRCHSTTSLKTLKITSEPQPVFDSLTSFAPAPATVANLGPGFDFLGCAVDGAGDYVTLSVDHNVKPGDIQISSINGSSKLSRNALLNCAGIAAMSVMEMLGGQISSGLGSSAASAAAAATSVNELFGGKLDVSDLVLAGLVSEEKVSGYHADNIAPAIMGGFVLIQNYNPLSIMRLPFPSEKDLFFVLVRVLPTEITLKEHIWNSTQAGALVAGILQGDLEALGLALSSDMIVEPNRAQLIPGMAGVKKVAIEAGAFGCTISGAGPTA